MSHPEIYYPLIHSYFSCADPCAQVTIIALENHYWSFDDDALKLSAMTDKPISTVTPLKFPAISFSQKSLAYHISLMSDLERKQIRLFDKHGMVITHLYNLNGNNEIILPEEYLNHSPDHVMWYYMRGPVKVPGEIPISLNHQDTGFTDACCQDLLPLPSAIQESYEREKLIYTRVSKALKPKDYTSCDRMAMAYKRFRNSMRTQFLNEFLPRQMNLF